MYGYDKIELKQTGIYKIINLINGNVYIGSAAVNFHKRWNQHLRLFDRNKNTRYLQNAWNKYGCSNFTFEIIEVVENVNIILDREQFYLDNIKNKYNILPTAGNMLGHKLSEETKRKISNSHIGIIPTKKARKKMSVSKQGSLNNRFGTTHNKDTKALMSKNAGKSCLGKFGKLHHNSKSIVQLKDGKIINFFDCMKDVERQLRFNRSNISKCCNGHLKKAYGFEWKFESSIDI